MPTLDGEPPVSSSDAHTGTHSVAHEIARILAAEGGSHVFTVPGGPLLSLLEAIGAHPSLTPVLAKHESGAAFMAHGWAQASGRLGIVCTTSGPGALQALPAAASATSDSVPMLVITAQTDSAHFGRGSLQDSSGGNWSVSTSDAFRSAVKLSAVASHPLQVTRLLRHALRTAMSGRPGAVHISIPADLISAPVPASSETRRINIPPQDPYPQAVLSLAHHIRRSRRGIILAGQGAKLSGAGRELITLAKLTGMPVATTMKGKSVFPEDHPLALGVFGFGGGPLAHREVLHEDVDLLLVIGSGLGELATNGWDPRLTAGRSVCQIDIDPVGIGSAVDVDVAVTADARTSLRYLLSRSGNTFQKQDHTLAKNSGDDPTGSSGKMTGSRALSVMNRILPPDAVMFADNGNCLSWLGHHYTSSPKRPVHVSLNIACMGYASGAAIGAQLAMPGRCVVALTGDAAFAMSGMEVHTATELDAPVIWVVLNNSGNAMVANIQNALYGKAEVSMYNTPLKSTLIARGLGAKASCATTEKTLEASLEAALRTDGPYLIEVCVDADEVPWALKGRIASLKGSFS